MRINLKKSVTLLKQIALVLHTVKTASIHKLFVSEGNQMNNNKILLNFQHEYFYHLFLMSMPPLFLVNTTIDVI